jgi:hypothetical protein
VLVGGFKLELGAPPQVTDQVWQLALGADGGAEFVQGALPTPDGPPPPPPSSAPPGASPPPSPGGNDLPRAVPSMPLNVGSAVGVGVGIVAGVALLFAVAQVAIRWPLRHPRTATLA